jgi:hypothetical protein
MRITCFAKSTSDLRSARVSPMRNPITAVIANDRAQWFGRIADNSLHLIVRKASRLFLHSLAGQGQICETEVSARIAPRPRCLEKRRKGEQHILCRLPGSSAPSEIRHECPHCPRGDLCQRKTAQLRNDAIGLQFPTGMCWIESEDRTKVLNLIAGRIDASPCGLYPSRHDAPAPEFIVLLSGWLQFG